MDGTEVEFANMLMEDSNNDALSYTDCESWSPCLQRLSMSNSDGRRDADIMSVHKTINEGLSGGGKGGGWFS